MVVLSVFIIMCYGVLLTVSVCICMEQRLQSATGDNRKLEIGNRLQMEIIEVLQVC